MKKSEAVLELILLAANLANDDSLRDALMNIWDKQMIKKRKLYID